MNVPKLFLARPFVKENSPEFTAPIAVLLSAHLSLVNDWRVPYDFFAGRDCIPMAGNLGKGLTTMLQRGAYLLLALCVFNALATAQNRVVIQGGTMIDVRNGNLMPDAFIVLEGDRIASISRGAGTAPPGATVIDARGKFILPGLIDQHVHYADYAPELFLNHGVTTVMDLGNDHEWIQAQKEGIESGLIPGPRMYVTTVVLDGPPKSEKDYFVRPYVQIVKGPEDVLAAMKRYDVEKVDGVKVYDGLSVESLRAIVKEAKRLKLPVIGHFKDVRTVADVGAEGVEHLWPVAHAVLDEKAEAEAKKKVRRGFNPPEESFMDLSKLPAIIDLMIQHKLYLNPTLRVSGMGDRVLREHGFQYQDFDLLINDWRLRYVPLSFRLGDLKEYQEIGVWHYSDLTQYEQDLFHQSYTNAEKIVKMFADAGGKLVAGTDSTHMCVAGLSLHQEMELLVSAGVTPLQALQAATINSAELMRVSDRLGTLEAGKAADLVILDANPLQDIRNTRKIARVISRGRVLDGQYHAEFQNPIPHNNFEDTSHFFPSPRIRSGTPEAVVEGAAGVKVTLQGTGFIPYSLIRFNGHTLPTDFHSESEISAEIPVKLLQPGTFAVTVENPDFAWGTIYARGASDIANLGIRDRISNQFLVMVKPKGGLPIYQPPASPRARQAQPAGD